MKLVRVLEYDGDEEAIRQNLRGRAVKGIAPRWARDPMEYVIKERFVLPDPLPEWWDEVVPGLVEEDPTKEKVTLVWMCGCGTPDAAVSDYDCPICGMPLEEENVLKSEKVEPPLELGDYPRSV